MHPTFMLQSVTEAWPYRPDKLGTRLVLQLLLTRELGLSMPRLDNTGEQLGSQRTVGTERSLQLGSSRSNPGTSVCGLSVP